LALSAPPSTSVARTWRAVRKAPCTVGGPAPLATRLATYRRMGIATSGRGSDLVVGWPAAVRPRPWPRCVRPSSPRASRSSAPRRPARQPGPPSQAGIEPSRTPASLTWRLDHGSLSLTDRHVVISDEASMTDDADWLWATTASPGGRGPKRRLRGPVASYGAAVHRLAAEIDDIDHLAPPPVIPPPSWRPRSSGAPWPGRSVATVAWHSSFERKLGCRLAADPGSPVGGTRLRSRAMPRPGGNRVSTRPWLCTPADHRCSGPFHVPSLPPDDRLHPVPPAKGFTVRYRALHPHHFETHVGGRANPPAGRRSCSW